MELALEESSAKSNLEVLLQKDFKESKPTATVN
jgi:hypothetical protein